MLSLSLLSLLATGVSSASMDGFVGLFTGACPSGWSVLSLLEGRLLLLANTSYQAGEPVGFPLSDGEDRAHSHVVSGSFNVPSKEVSAWVRASSFARPRAAPFFHTPFPPCARACRAARTLLRRTLARSRSCACI